MIEETETSHRPKSALPWIFALLALLMLAAAVYLFLENKSLWIKISQNETERNQSKQREQKLQQQLAEQKSSEAQIKEELARVQKDLKRAERQLFIHQKEAKEEEVPKDVKITPLKLSPHTRGMGQTQLLSLSKEIDYVSVTLQLESSDFSSYQITLTDPRTGKNLWKSSILKPVERTIQFGIPAKVLSDEEYVFELSGVSEDGTAQVISGYPFRIIIE
jgi:hypothetical protein